MIRPALAVFAAVALLSSTYLVVQDLLARENVGLIATEPDVQLGRVKQGEVFNVEYELTNSSSSALEILRVMPNRDCLDVQLSGRVVPPGQSVGLRTSWNVGTRRGPSRSRLRVEYSRPKSDEIWEAMLSISADVEPDYDLVPASLFLSPDETHVEVRLIPRRSESIRILEAYSSHDGLTILPSADGLSFKVVPDRSVPPQAEAVATNDRSIIVVTSSTTEPTFRIPVRTGLGAETSNDMPSSQP